MFQTWFRQERFYWPLPLPLPNPGMMGSRAAAPTSTSSTTTGGAALTAGLQMIFLAGSQPKIGCENLRIYFKVKRNIFLLIDIFSLHRVLGPSE